MHFNETFFLFSFADSQDVDLDAILGELCALEQRCEGEIASTPVSENQGQVGRPLNGRINSGETTEISKNDGKYTNSSSKYLSKFENVSEIALKKNFKGISHYYTY